MNHDQTKRHEMILEKTHETGAEEWYCPTCGRRLLMTWPPEYKKIILCTGDELAIHSGGTGCADGTPPETVQTEEVQPINEESLAIWEDWMDRVDFESLWYKEDY